jgi:hypothetical protein
MKNRHGRVEEISCFVQVDSEGKVNILEGGSIGHCEKQFI